jgi:hypothetical protein
LSPSYEVMWGFFIFRTITANLTNRTQRGKNMRNTYTVTYRSSGRIKAEELPADTYFDAAAAVRQSHHLKASAIISNEIRDTETGRRDSKRALQIPTKTFSPQL